MDSLVRGIFIWKECLITEPANMYQKPQRKMSAIYKNMAVSLSQYITSVWAHVSLEPPHKTT